MNYLLVANDVLIDWNRMVIAGDMEFKQNKFLPAEKQIVTANPDVNIVSAFSFYCN